VQYAPGAHLDSVNSSEAKDDPAVSRTANEPVEGPAAQAAGTKPSSSGAPAGRLAARAKGAADWLPPSPFARLQPPAAPGVLDQPGAALDLPALPPAQPPISVSPEVPSATQPDVSDIVEAATEASAAAASNGDQQEPYGFCKRFFRGYPRLVLWFPRHLGPPREGGPTLNGEDANGAGRSRESELAGGGDPEPPAAPRRAPPSPWDSPPFPSSEYQGYPLIGVPTSISTYPLQTALNLGPYGDVFKDSRIGISGWVTSSGNWSNAHRSNIPTAYWIVPNAYELDQAVIKFERPVDSVQTDHIDWGFRSIHLYGIDYRYTTAGGWASQQLLYHNNLYGYDPIEQYFEVYIPRVWEGMSVRVGRWIACPDIETQYAPDNYLGTHSLLFTYDTYTQTGAMFSFQLNQRNMVQGAIHSGTDMAPWYPGALATGMFGWRWVSEDNNDSFYTVLNSINNAKFRYFMADGRKSGHDNFNYIVSTWQHRFTRRIHTKTEAYFMWQFDAVLGGTPSLGPVMSFGGGGGLGKFIPGMSRTYGVLNYTMFQLSNRDYFTVRNEWWRDEQGERSGFPSNYSSHTIGISHQFNDLMMIRPEIGFYHSYDVPAFDLGKNKNLLMYGFDFTIRF
jgi:hypothetical protein